jgi:hypothetical protein
MPSTKKRGKRREPAAAKVRHAPVHLSPDVHPFYDSDFVPVRLTKELCRDSGVQLMLQGIKYGPIEEWSFGRKGTHISSRFRLSCGLVDTLTSPLPHDENFALLLVAHIGRLKEILFGDDDTAPSEWVTSTIACTDNGDDANAIEAQRIKALRDHAATR